MGATASLLSCNRQVEAALDTAGANRAEMEKVLDYFKGHDDTLRYEAAVFLMKNMPYRYCLKEPGTESVDSAYLAVSLLPAAHVKVGRRLASCWLLDDMRCDSLSCNVNHNEASYSRIRDY